MPLSRHWAISRLALERYKVRPMPALSPHHTPGKCTTSRSSGADVHALYARAYFYMNKRIGVRVWFANLPNCY